MKSCESNLNDRIVKVLEENDYRLTDVSKQDGEFTAEIETYSPAGEDVIITVWFDGTDEGFVDAFAEYSNDFDVDDHVSLWVDMRGTHGVPGTIKELMEDAEAIKEGLAAMAGRLRDVMAYVKLKAQIMQAEENRKHQLREAIKMPERDWQPVDTALALDILDELDAYRRRKALENETNVDYVLRMVEAFIADRAGFKARFDWMECLAEKTDSQYVADCESDMYAY